MANNHELFIFINSACSILPAWFWMSISVFGTGWMIFATTLPAILFAPRVFYAILITAPIAGGISRFTKLALGFPRPPAVLERDSFNLIGQAIERYSMPSGHTLAAFAAACCLYFCSSQPVRPWLLPVFLGAFLVGLSRIAIGVHWPEDVVVGALMGLAAGYVGSRLALLLPERLMAMDSGWLRFFSLWGLVCLYALLTERLDFPENKAVQWCAAALVSVVLLRFWGKSFGTNRL